MDQRLSPVRWPAIHLLPPARAIAPVRHCGSGPNRPGSQCGHSGVRIDPRTVAIRYAVIDRHVIGLAERCPPFPIIGFLADVLDMVDINMPPPRRPFVEKIPVQKTWLPARYDIVQARPHKFVALKDQPAFQFPGRTRSRRLSGHSSQKVR